jgi:WD40 repeat protein
MAGKRLEPTRAAVPLLLAALAAAPGAVTRQTPEPKPPARARADPHGYPLPPGATARLGRLHFRHSSAVSALAFSPDGKRMAVAGGRLRLWELATGRELPPPLLKAGENVTTHTVAISPDGKLLAYGGQSGVLRLCDLTAGKVLRQFPRQPFAVLAVAFSPDGKTLASGGSFEDTDVHLWDVATGRERRRLTGHERGVSALAFSPDRSTLASGGYDGTVRLWDLASGKGRILRRHRETILGVAFSRDGKLLASLGRGEKTLRLWDAATGKEVRELRGPDCVLGAFAFSPDGKTLAGVDLGTLRLWDLATGQQTRTFETYHSTFLAYLPDGKTLACAEGNGAIRFRQTSGEPGPTQEAPGEVERVAFSPDGKTLFAVGGAVSRRAHLWDLATGKGRALRDGAQGPAWATDDATRLHAGKPDLPAGEVLALAPDGKTVAIYRRDRRDRPHLLLWDRSKRKELARWSGLTANVNVAAFSPDGKALALGGRLWYRDGMLVSPSKENPLSWWDVATGKELRRFGRHHHSFWWLGFSPDGRTLASVSDDKIRVWEVATGKELWSLGPQSTRPVFSPDSKTLAVGGEDGTVRLWEVATGRPRGRFQGHHGAVVSLAFRPDGKALASGGWDTTILIWDLARANQSEAGEREGGRTFPAVRE